MWQHAEPHTSFRHILLTHAGRALTDTQPPPGNHWLSEYPAVTRCVNNCGNGINGTSRASFECRSPALHDRTGGALPIASIAPPDRQFLSEPDACHCGREPPALGRERSSIFNLQAHRHSSGDHGGHGRKIMQKPNTETTATYPERLLAWVSQPCMQRRVPD